MDIIANIVVYIKKISEKWIFMYSNLITFIEYYIKMIIAAKITW
jgi:hypothetical protein